MHENITEERSPIFVKELEWTSKKIFKYEKSTYVNIFGPDQKIYWKTKIIILIFLLTFRKNQRIDRSFFLFFLLKKLRIDRSFFFFFLFSFFFFPLKNRGLVYRFLDSYLLTPPIRSIKVISQILVFVQLRDRTILKHIFWDRQFICKIGDLSKHFDISSYLKIVKTFLQQIKIVKTFLQKNKIVKSSLQNIEIVKTSLRKNKKCKKVFT